MKPALSLLFAQLPSSCATTVSHAAQLLAGVAKGDITDRAAGPVNDPSYVKALVLKDGSTTVVLVTVDAVAPEWRKIFDERTDAVLKKLAE